MSRRCIVLFAAAILFLASRSASFAQDASPNDSSAPKASQKPKKTWTNDDVTDLRAHSTISTVGEEKNDARKPGMRRPSSENSVRAYRAQIDQLQARLADIDKQIASLRAAENGETVDSTRKYDAFGGKIGDWKAQIDQLQKNRQDLLRQIDAVETQLRQNNP
jgi:chromosome segregation ATPase